MCVCKTVLTLGRIGGGVVGVDGTGDSPTTPTREDWEVGGVESCVLEGLWADIVDDMMGGMVRGMVVGMVVGMVGGMVVGMVVGMVGGIVDENGDFSGSSLTTLNQNCSQVPKLSCV